MAFAVQRRGQACESLFGKVLPGVGKPFTPVYEVHIEDVCDCARQPGFEGCVVHQRFTEGRHGQKFHVLRHAEIHRLRADERQGAADGYADDQGDCQIKVCFPAVSQRFAVIADGFHRLITAAFGLGVVHGVSPAVCFIAPCWASSAPDRSMASMSLTISLSQRMSTS